MIEVLGKGFKSKETKTKEKTFGGAYSKDVKEKYVKKMYSDELKKEKTHRLKKEVDHRQMVLNKYGVGVKISGGKDSLRISLIGPGVMVYRSTYTKRKLRSKRFYSIDFLGIVNSRDKIVGELMGEYKKPRGKVKRAGHGYLEIVKRGTDIKLKSDRDVIFMLDDEKGIIFVFHHDSSVSDDPDLQAYESGGGYPDALLTPITEGFDFGEFL